ncbi:MAG TPA: hypothetical protein VJ921_11995 [Vicinamibacteria bacterium]|nr:hypothetical protein [Vicinamibacteria bacterium]
MFPIFDDLSPSEADRLKKRYELWREAMDRLKSEPGTPIGPIGDEPLFPGELEKPT